jgi:3-oxoacyl-[acyl-carrier protein] reductase
MNFSGKNILITGASRGIGKACAVAFADKGANIGINYKSDFKAAKDCLKLLGEGNHILLQTDISNSVEAKNLIDKFVSEFGKIDVLINNAAISAMHEIDLVDYETWQKSWRSIIDTNLISVANLSYCAAQYMIKQDGGKIINVSSRGAFRGEPAQTAYGASKAGLNSLTQSMAKALAKYNIFVSAVAPGFTETDMGNTALTEKEKIALMNECPLKRMATPQEVAYSVMFLASDEANYSTGAILDINGASYLR